MYKKSVFLLIMVTSLLVSGCQQEEKVDSKPVETGDVNSQETSNNNATEANQDSNNATDNDAGESSTIKGSDHASAVHKNSNQQNATNSNTVSNDDFVTKDTAALVMADYINGLTTAINTGQFSNVSHVLRGSLYNDQQSLVSNLYKKGIKENWVDYSVVNFTKAGNSSDGPLYKIQTLETVSVIQPDGSQKTNKYNWMYTAVLINNQLYLTDIAKNGPITTVSKTGPTTSTPSTNSSGTTITNSKKAYYLDLLEQTRVSEVQPVNDQIDGDRRQASGANYQMWDQVLNDIYGELKNQLPASEMNDLKIKQRQWIKDRDAASQKELKEAGGGTLAYAEEARILLEMTRERCYELVTYYMK